MNIPLDKGLISQRRIGTALKSPLCYSKKEIKQALAVAKLSNILTTNLINNEQ